MKYFCTSYCNQGHSLSSGVPLDHTCYVLPPKALKLEQKGKYPEALAVIQAAKPLKGHSGSHCRHAWHRVRCWSQQGYVVRQYMQCIRCYKEREHA